MEKPMVGVIGDAGMVDNLYRVQLVGQRKLIVLAEVAGARPPMLAGLSRATDLDARSSTPPGQDKGRR